MTARNWNTDHVAAFYDWAESHGYSIKTRASYSAMFFHFVALLEKNGIRLKDASQTLVGDYLKKKAVSEKTKGVYLWLLSDIFNDMIDNGEIDANPVERLLDAKKKNQRGRAPKRIPLALSEHETGLLLAHVDHMPKHYTGLRTRCAILLMLGCGLRAQEVCDLRDADMHLDDEEPYLVVIGKGNRERAVPVPEVIIPTLTEFRDMRCERQKVFLSAKGTGNPYTPSGVYRMVRRALDAAGIVKTRMSPHVLRHTYATNQLRAGVSLPTVKVWMGHDFISTTARYEHVVAARRDERPVIL